VNVPEAAAVEDGSAGNLEDAGAEALEGLEEPELLRPLKKRPRTVIRVGSGGADNAIQESEIVEGDEGEITIDLRGGDQENGEG